MSNQKLTEEQVKKILHGIHVPPQPQILVDLQMEQIMPLFPIKVTESYWGSLVKTMFRESAWKSNFARTLETLGFDD